MVTLGRASAATATAGADQPDGDSPDHYTGVVIIHGIGDEKRNETLQEALNALTHWFNHTVGLALRPEGPGRVWLRTALTIDDDPDAPASRATLELAAPSALTAASGGDPVLRLELREVWWAQSFGVPSLRSVFRWARVQFREELRSILLPMGLHVGPVRAAYRSPAREIRQAATYRPFTAGKREPTPARAPAPPPIEEAKAASSIEPRRVAIVVALWCYGIVQYVWKLVQWLLLTPLIYCLLALVSLVRAIAIFPFIRNTLLGWLSSLVEYVSLHWIAPLQVYLLDYTRAASIRQVFEREVQVFLDDERCDRLVVLAHSMGTVIAYEGLATVLTKPTGHASWKPTTFVCLGQALRRMWVLPGADPHRLRTALPEWVRWIHFWAHYDPVAAGPLRAGSLPAHGTWTDPEIPDPYEAMCAALDRCENVDVVNADSLLSDHNLYWQNMEQVVGPIARELVAGHPALEHLVDARLATAQDVLQRRWGVAWRNGLAVLGSLAIAAALPILDQQAHLGIGNKLKDVYGVIAGALAVVGKPFGIDLQAVGSAKDQLVALLQKQNPLGLKDFLGSLSQAAQLDWTPVLTLVTALAILFIGPALNTRLIALPSPLAPVFAPSRGRTWTVFLLSSASWLLLIALVALLYYSASLSDIFAGVPGVLKFTLLGGPMVWIGLLLTL